MKGKKVEEFKGEKKEENKFINHGFVLGWHFK